MNKVGPGYILFLSPIPRRIQMKKRIKHWEEIQKKAGKIITGYKKEIKRLESKHDYVE